MPINKNYIYAAIVAIGGSIGVYLKGLTEKSNNKSTVNIQISDTKNKPVADIAMEYEKLKQENAKKPEFVEEGIKEKVREFFKNNPNQTSFNAVMRVEMLEDGETITGKMGDHRKLMQIVSRRTGEEPIPFFAKSSDNISAKNYHKLQKGGVYIIDVTLFQDGKVLLGYVQAAEYMRIPQDFETKKALEKLKEPMAAGISK